MLLRIAEVAVRMILSKKGAPCALHVLSRGAHREFEARVALREGDLAHAVATCLGDRSELVVGGVPPVGRTAPGTAAAFEFGAELLVAERAEVETFLE